MKLYYVFLLAGCLILLVGCAGATGDISSPDPIIKGASYIACAIVTHGVLAAIFNK